MSLYTVKLSVVAVNILLLSSNELIFVKIPNKTLWFDCLVSLSILPNIKSLFMLVVLNSISTFSFVISSFMFSVIFLGTLSRV